MVKRCLMFHSTNPVEHDLSNCGTRTTIRMKTTAVGVFNQKTQKIRDDNLKI